MFFFFQAEDGIRDHCVTGVQTCALFFSSRRRHTRSLCDWSSDVCSSDLCLRWGSMRSCSNSARLKGPAGPEAGGRKRVVLGKSVDLGGRRIIKKKKKKKRGGEEGEREWEENN